MAVEATTDEESPLLDPPDSVQLHRLRRSTSNTTSQVALVGANICPIESLDYEYVIFPIHMAFIVFRI